MLDARSPYKKGRDQVSGIDIDKVLNSLKDYNMNMVSENEKSQNDDSSVKCVYDDTFFH